MSLPKSSSAIAALMFCVVNAVSADGLAIDKVYHPYVQALEREVEWRMISADGEQKQRFGLGMSWSDRLFTEVYIITNESNNKDLDVSAYELEALYQLTEQGEYSADWGLIVELERERHAENWEAVVGLISEKEFGRWVGTANLKAIYEWGDTIKDELESSLAMQLRYRYSRYLEPAVELYTGQNTRGFGPVIQGDVKLKGRKKLHWEAGAIFAFDSKTPDKTWRLLTEFEF